MLRYITIIFSKVIQLDIIRDGRAWQFTDLIDRCIQTHQKKKIHMKIIEIIIRIATHTDHDMSELCFFIMFNGLVDILWVSYTTL